MPIQAIFSSYHASRAITALRRRRIREGAVFQQPAEPECYRDTASADTFIVLRNVNGVLAVYRERASGRSLRQVEPGLWPDGLRQVIAD